MEGEYVHMLGVSRIPHDVSEMLIICSFLWRKSPEKKKKNFTESTVSGPGRGPPIRRNPSIEPLTMLQREGGILGYYHQLMLRQWQIYGLFPGVLEEFAWNYMNLESTDLFTVYEYLCVLICMYKLAYFTFDVLWFSVWQVVHIHTLGLTNIYEHHPTFYHFADPVP